MSATEGAVREGFAMVQMARALIRQPNLVNYMKRAVEARERALRERERQVEGDEVTAVNVVDVRSPCTHCNECVIATMDESVGLHCPLLGRDIEDLQ